MFCFNCKKKIIGKPIVSEPNRSMVSPGSINRWFKDKKDFYYDHFCSELCKKKTDGARYKFWAGLDRNASDSECFVHSHWETDSLHRKIRVGYCKITGKEVRVEPLQPGNNSGQPIECYEHFELRSNYK